MHPELATCARGRRRPGLPGRRRGTRPAARARPRRHRSRRRGRRGGARRAAGRRSDRARALRHRQGEARRATRSTSPRARSETYPHPGALPVVEPAADLAGRSGAPRLHDQRDGDPAARRATPDRPIRRRRPTWRPGGCGSCTPTRSSTTRPGRFAPRRYAARFGFELEPETAELLRESDLSTVSADRRDAELLRLAAEAKAPRAASSCSASGAWSSCAQAASSLSSAVAELLAAAPWGERGAPRAGRCFAAALGPRAARRRWPRRAPSVPRRRSRWPRGHDPVELVLARALGAEWLDRYLAEWREVTLEIDGADLIAAGVPPGPGAGAGPEEALRRKLDGEIDGPRGGAGGGAGDGREGATMEWREARACAGSRPSCRRASGLLDPPAGSASRPSTPQPRRLTEDECESVVENLGRLAAALGLRPGASRQRPPGARRRAGHPRRPQAPSPFAEPAPRSPRSTATSPPSPGLAPLVFVADCLPVAARRPRRAWRCCTAAGAAWRPGIVAQGRRRRSAPPTRRSAPVSGPVATRWATRCSRPSPRSATASPPGGCSTCRRWRAGCCARRGSSRSRRPGSARAASAELFFSHRRDGGRTGRQAGLVWLDREEG